MEEYLYQRFYEIENRHWWFVARRAILMNYLLHKLRTVRQLSLLDVGCGTGALLAEATHHFETYGVDSSPTAIDYCRKRGVKNLFVGTLNEYPAMEKFDVILLLDVIEHIDDDLAILQLVRTRLNEGGFVLVTVPAYQWLWGGHDVVNHHKRRYTATRLRAVMQRAGFHIVHLTYFNTLLFPLAVIRRVAAKLIGSRQADDFVVPANSVNQMLRSIFGVEKHIVPRIALPFGLSVLCWATKTGT